MPLYNVYAEVGGTFEAHSKGAAEQEAARRLEEIGFFLADDSDIEAVECKEIAEKRKLIRYDDKRSGAPMALAPGAKNPGRVQGEAWATGHGY
jgi:hypothetical protein